MEDDRESVADKRVRLAATVEDWITAPPGVRRDVCLERMVELTNQIRATSGLPPVSLAGGVRRKESP